MGSSSNGEGCGEAGEAGRAVEVGGLVAGGGGLLAVGKASAEGKQVSLVGLGMAGKAWAGLDWTGLGWAALGCCCWLGSGVIAWCSGTPPRSRAPSLESGQPRPWRSGRAHPS